MPLINCKFELKIRWTKHCVLSVLGNEYDTTLYVPVIPLLGKHNQNYQNFLSKDLNDLCIGINTKQKIKIKIP